MCCGRTPLLPNVVAHCVPAVNALKTVCIRLQQLQIRTWFLKPYENHLTPKYDASNFWTVVQRIQLWQLPISVAQTRPPAHVQHSMPAPVSKATVRKNRSSDSEAVLLYAVVLSAVVVPPSAFFNARAPTVMPTGPRKGHVKASTHHHCVGTPALPSALPEHSITVRPTGPRKGHGKASKHTRFVVLLRCRG